MGVLVGGLCDNKLIKEEIFCVWNGTIDLSGIIIGINV